MSTDVDKKRRAARVLAEQMRDRILGAARLAFTRAGYDSVGVREIAALVPVDPAMVPRLFGSKEALFTLAADAAFGLDPVFTGPLAGMGERVARHLSQPITPPRPDGFHEFAFLLRSVGSPAAAPILSAALHRSFIAPLSRLMSGPDAEARAALVTAHVLGFAILRAGLGSSLLEGAKGEAAARGLARAIQESLDAPLAVK